MNRFRFLLLLVALVAAGPAFAGAAEGNRYLVIVQTSKEMKPALAAARTCLRSLLVSGMNQQLQAGDTLGLWTYDRELAAGKFPMQVWTPAARTNLAQRVDEFLAKQAGKDAARIGEMLPALFRVVEDSPTLTVLLFTDGFEPVTGTPFDEIINRVFTEHRAAMRKSQTPFVTVIQARGGKILRCTVNSAAGAVSIPVLPPPPPTKPAPPVAPVAPAPVVINTNRPLILDFSKPATNEVVPKISESGAPVTNRPGAAGLSTVPLAKPALSNLTAGVRTQPQAQAETLAAITGQVNSVESGATSSPPVAWGAATTVRAARGLWLLGGVVGGGLVVWVWLAWRRRGAARPSAITECIERRKR